VAKTAAPNRAERAGGSGGGIRIDYKIAGGDGYYIKKLNDGRDDDGTRIDNKFAGCNGYMYDESGGGGSVGKNGGGNAGRYDGKSDAGAFYIDALIGFVILISLVFSFLTIPELIIRKQELDYIANTVVRRIERDGMAGSVLRQTINELCAETGMSADVEWNGAFRGANSKLQVRDRFTVTARYTVRVKLIEPSFARPVYVSIPIQKTLSGVSEVYWKDFS